MRGSATVTTIIALCSPLPNIGCAGNEPLTRREGKDVTPRAALKGHIAATVIYPENLKSPGAKSDLPYFIAAEKHRPLVVRSQSHSADDIVHRMFHNQLEGRKAVSVDISNRNKRQSTFEHIGGAWIPLASFRLESSGRGEGAGDREKDVISREGHILGETCHN
jgi:hypothetical protein